MSDGKTCWILAGPNGAGKTTLRKHASQFHPWGSDIEWIDPDEIAKTLVPEAHSRTDIRAATIAIEKIEECIAAGRSFGMEATLSASYHNILAERLREKGWKVGVVYVGLESPELSLKRVEGRVAKGGHDVGDTLDMRHDTTHRRFFTAIKKLPKLIKNSDEAYLLDNSKTSGFDLLAAGKNGTLVDFSNGNDTRLMPIKAALRNAGILMPRSWATFLEDPLLKQKEKVAWIIAGPNGAGKSTFMSSPWSSDLKKLPLINTDIIARELAPDDPDKQIFSAGRIALNAIDERIQHKESFVIETTLSGNSQLNLMRKLKKEGWKVGLVYVSLASPELSLNRIAHRVSRGGHDVPPKDVMRRWPRTAGNAPAAVCLADTCHILDNTGDHYTHVAQGRDGMLQDLTGDRSVLPDLMDGIREQGLISQSSQNTHEKRSLTSF